MAIDIALCTCMTCLAVRDGDQRDHKLRIARIHADQLRIQKVGPVAAAAELLQAEANGGLDRKMGLTQAEALSGIGYFVETPAGEGAHDDGAIALAYAVQSGRDCPMPNRSRLDWVAIGLLVACALVFWAMWALIPAPAAPLPEALPWPYVVPF